MIERKRLTPDDIRRPADNGADGRDAKGKFRPGNTVGRGNPLGLEQARLREEARKAVTPGELQAVLGALQRKALKGDVPAAHVWLQYQLGKPRVMDAPASAAIQLPELATLTDCATAASRVFAAVSAGELRIDEGRAFSDMIAGVRAAIEAGELERRLLAVEQRLDQLPEDPNR